MYVNYAMVEDFIKLRDMNISVAGHIVIAKYGKIYRGDKVSEFIDPYIPFQSRPQTGACAFSIKFNNGFRTCVEREAAVANAGSPSILPRGLNFLVLSTKIMASLRKIDSLSRWLPIW